MAIHPILLPMDDPEEFAYRAARRRARRRFAFWVMAALASILLAIGVKGFRHLAAAGELSSQGFQVDWSSAGSGWMTGGYTSVRYISRYDWNPTARRNTLKAMDFRPLTALIRVDVLDLSRSPLILDSELEILERLPEIRELNLTRAGVTQFHSENTTKLTDAACDRINSLAKLEILILNRQAITDAGVAKLAGLAGLMEVELRETAITDAALETFKRMPNLNSLDVSGTRVSPEAIQKFVEVMPKVKVVNEPDRGPPVPRRF